MLDTLLTSMRSPRRTCLVLALCSVSLGGCLKDEGGPCQLQSDCSGGLICDLAPGTARGVCRTTATVDSGTGVSGDGGDVPLPADDASTAGQDGG